MPKKKPSKSAKKKPAKSRVPAFSTTMANARKAAAFDLGDLDVMARQREFDVVYGQNTHFEGSSGSLGGTSSSPVMFLPELKAIKPKEQKDHFSKPILAALFVVVALSAWAVVRIVLGF